VSFPDELLEASIGRGKKIGVSDVEADGLVHELSRIHCATWEDLLTGEHKEWTPDNIKEYPEFLMDEVGVCFGHNFVGYDNRAIKKVYPKYKAPVTMDTLAMCKMVWPADLLMGPDMKRFRAGKMPGKYLKRQSLGAWGYRLGNYKGEYDGGWDVWNPEMQVYMVQDGKVNVDLVHLILRRIGWVLPGRDSAIPEGTYVWPYLPFWIENEMAAIIAEQEAIGVGFDHAKATEFAADLKNQQAAMTEDLRRVFGSWWAPLDHPERGRKINRSVVRNMKGLPAIKDPEVGKLAGLTFAAMKGLKKAPDHTGEYVKEYHHEGSVYCRVEYTEFNPNSRDHLADRLKRVFNWKPDTFTSSGKAQVDENVIESLPSSVIDQGTRETILNYYVVTKTLGQLADGPKSWMYCVADDGAIHGRCDPLGTITSRAAHFGPNLGQIPSVEVEEVKDAAGKILKKIPKFGIKGRFGYECRNLFIAGGLMPNAPEHRKDKVELTGSDIHSLEFVMLGHYLEPYDGGKFRDRAADPDRDLHAEHAQWTREAGWDGATRANCKTLGFLIIYGGGALKAGLGMGVEEWEIPMLVSDKGLPNRLRFMKKRMGPAYEEPSDLDKARIVKGARGIKAIKDVITGLQDLMDGVQEVAKERGYVIAIDGRKLAVRKAHAALNTLLQGGGSVVCKLWQIEFQRMMRERGYFVIIHYNQVLWVHDEKQDEHIAGLGPVVSEVAALAALEAGKKLKLRGTLHTESKTGRSWAETH
jgi:DNA polymerase-1